MEAIWQNCRIHVWALCSLSDVTNFFFSQRRKNFSGNFHKVVHWMNTWAQLSESSNPISVDFPCKNSRRCCHISFRWLEMKSQNWQKNWNKSWGGAVIWLSHDIPTTLDWSLYNPQVSFGLIYIHEKIFTFFLSEMIGKGATTVHFDQIKFMLQKHGNFDFAKSCKLTQNLKGPDVV